MSVSVVGVGVVVGVFVDNGFGVGVDELVGIDVGIGEGSGHVFRLLYVEIVHIAQISPPSEFSPMDVLYPKVLG